MVWYGNVETVAFLLKNKANKEAWDKLGRRPKDLARDILLLSSSFYSRMLASTRPFLLSNDGR